MQIWSAEIKELEALFTSIKGRFPELEKDPEHLIITDIKWYLKYLDAQAASKAIKDPRVISCKSVEQYRYSMWDLRYTYMLPGLK
jgi:hypothetical protein